MFGKRPEPAQPKKVDTIIGKETQIAGHIIATGTIRVDGRVEGDIAADGDVVVGESGRIVASVRARNVTIAGEVQGDVCAGGRLEIVPSGRLYGDVRTAVLAIEDGAVFKGMCEMITDTPQTRPLLPVEAAAPALPEGTQEGQAGNE